MGVGIRRTIRKLIIQLNRARFISRKKIFGFGNAAALFQTMDKFSAIKILQDQGAKIGRACDIETPLLFHNCTSFENLTIGKNCHIGKNCFFDLSDKITIEENVVVSMQSTFITHIDMTKSDLSKNYSTQNSAITIGKNTYIGANSTLLMGIELSEKCLVAAGSVVNKSFPHNSIIGGVPAKLIKKIK